jgi:DNA-binding NarL/FixJ family response regulator
MIDLERIYEPPSDEAYQALKDDIAANGQSTPIIVDEHDRIIDGFTRKRICEELGIFCRQTIKARLDDDAKLETAITHNMRNRKVSKDQRNAIIEALKRRGWSNRKIAETLGIDHSTVRESVTGGIRQSPTPPLARDGRTVQRTPYSPEETSRRQAFVRELYRAGYSVEPIAEAMGVSAHTVRRDLNAGEIVRRGKGTKGKGNPSGPFKWRDQDIAPLVSVPKPEVVSQYREMTIPIVRHLVLFVEDFRDKDYANQFAWRIDEGINDRAWVREQRELLETITDQTQRLLMIIRDPEYRTACRETLEGRENMRKPTLRAVD